MFGNKFYYRTTRRAIIAFGSIFNDVYIQRDSQKGEDFIEQTIRVPLTFCNKQKFEQAIRQQPDKENRQFAVILPRMAFEITSYEYDISQKTQSSVAINKYLPTQNTGTSIGVPSGDVELLSQYQPATYKLNFSLYAATTNLDDMLQIFEHIVPFFTPHYSLKIKWIPELNVESDFPITLVSVDPGDTFEGVLNDRREIMWAFRFEARVKYYGPTTNRKIIKHVSVPLHANYNSMPDEWDEKLLADVVPEDAGPLDNFVIEEQIVRREL